ncbi:hypothetical protein-putative related to sulfatases [hydrothermal vent metagenome]|uniref:Sulfatase n=1 Tax=hydrothermal vent metagenome TaxID=652676 RepID=A0A3B1DV30_9ZZZZ
MNDYSHLSCRNFSRRHLLKSVACGFGSLALSGLCAEAAPASQLPLAPRKPMYRARAKRVIFIFMPGAISHVDAFDYKPTLEKHHGEKLDFKNARKIAETGMTGQETVMKSLWKFRRYGECGRQVSDLFPSIAQHVDKLCFVHSMHTNGVAHGPASLFLHTGANNFIRPSVGSWITYGLGTENQNLPGFITISPAFANGGPRNYSNAFLPSHYQGTTLGIQNLSAKLAKFQYTKNAQWSRKTQKEQLNLLQAINKEQSVDASGNDELAAVISSYELAFRMQKHAPQLTDLTSESKETHQLYGIGNKITDEFGRQCLMARRMAEAGVRYIQITHDGKATPQWDHHSKMYMHEPMAREVDKPVAGLLADLEARGLLEDTLVWFGSEFGRTPFSQNSDGRDHNPKGFTHILCGGGAKPGFAYGATDEFGHEAVENKVHMHDMHATILHMLGMNHENLTYRHAGRDYRLTDIAGNIIHDIVT